MRIVNALKADLHFQIKQGFFTVYFFVTLFYIIVMHYLPETLVPHVVPFLIFSDPSFVGFFFIGAIVMLEKSQGILQYLVVTPLRSKEYMIAKIISLTVLAEAAGIAIALFAYSGKIHWVLLISGIFLTSVFFTLYGFIAASGCNTMNQYFIRMIPYLLLATLPCFSLLVPQYNYLFNIFPVVSGLKLVYGSFHYVPVWEFVFCFVYLAIVNVWMLFKVESIFVKRMVYGGE